MPYDKATLFSERGYRCECGCGKLAQDAHHALIGRRKRFPELDCPENILLVVSVPVNLYLPKIPTPLQVIEFLKQMFVMIYQQDIFGTVQLWKSFTPSDQRVMCVLCQLSTPTLTPLAAFLKQFPLVVWHIPPDRQ